MLRFLCVAPTESTHWGGNGFVLECEMWEGLYLSFTTDFQTVPWHCGWAWRAPGEGVGRWA